MSLIGYELARAVGWTMIHSLWEGFAIAVIVLGFSHRRSCEQRYVAQCLGLAVLMAAVVTTFALEVRKDANAFGAYEVLNVVKANIQPGGLSPAFAKEKVSTPTSVGWDNVARGLAYVWMAGFVIMSVRATCAAWRVRSLRRNATRWREDSWQQRLRDWSRELGISRSIQLCLTEFNDVPAVIGHFKPIVLLPAGIITRLSTGQIEALILHELMHIRRSDYLVNVLQLVCETLLFFHPIAWWLSARIREERELCCDAQVATRDTSPLPYAKALVALEELRLGPAGILAVGAGGSSLKRRITRLLAPPQSATGTGGWALSLCSLALIALLGFSFWPKAIAQPITERSLFQIRMVVEDGGEELPFVGRNGAGKLRVAREVVLNDTHVKSAASVKDPISGDPQISISLNNEGAERFAKATRDNVGKQAAIVINQQIVSAPRINEPITGGMLVINGNFSVQEAADLARKLSPIKSEKKEAAIKLQPLFIELTGNPAEQFNLGTKMDSATDDIMAWKLSQEEARKIAADLQKTPGAKLVAAPIITTLSGKAARVEVGDVADKDDMFSVNAKGFVTTKEPTDPEFALVGQSIELLPELGRDNLIIAGKFLNREKSKGQNGLSFVRTVNSAPFYLNLPRGSSFALAQQSKADPKKFLLLLVVAEINE